MIRLKDSVLTGSAEMTAGLQTSMNMVMPNYQTGLLEDMLSTGKNNESSTVDLNNLYREIYLYDTVSGPTVDLMCNLPWSDFTLTGVNDPVVKRIYEDSLYELNVEDLMPRLSVSYLVLGTVIGSLIFNESKGIFTDLIVQDPDFTEVTEIPLSGYDPKIDLKVNPEFKKFLRSKDPRDVAARKEIPSTLLNKLLKGNKIELEPLSTIYINRNYVPGLNTVSYYNRIVPIWLIEKALMRGTIIGSWRRQRSVLHVQVGHEDWTPTSSQLASIAQMFTNADQDPQGAVVVTRQGIETNEIRDGSSFWKVSDEWDVFANAKMRALGVSEAFLTGDSNFSTQEIALSVFMDNLRAFRVMLTNKVIYDKIFIMLAKFHGFKRRTQAELNHRLRLTSSKTVSNYNDYNIPTINWHKDLKSKYDMSYSDALDKAKEQGIPIPLTLYASVAGLNSRELMSALEDDIKFRQDIKTYNDKLAALGETPTTGDDEDAVFSSVADSARSERFKRSDPSLLQREQVLSEDTANKILAQHS